MNLFIYLFVWSACCAPIFTQQFNTLQVQLNCTTPEGHNGYCVTLSQCPLEVNVATQNRGVAEGYVPALKGICGTQNNNEDPVVCCMRPMETIPATTSNSFTQNPFLPIPQTIPIPYLQTTPSRNTGSPQTENPVLPSSEQIQVTTAGAESHAVIMPNTDEIPRRLPKVSEGCGYSKTIFKKIVGGRPAIKGSFPWIALIGYEDELAMFKCGGSLITTRHVVTAAHCILRNLVFVRLGEHDLSTDQEAQHVDINVVKMVAHPEYSKKDGHSDIAMLYLERNVKLTDTISPICIPNLPQLRTKDYTSYNPFVAGWGKVLEGGKSSDVLQVLQIPVLENSMCLDAYTKLKRVFTTKQFNSAVLCAGVIAGGMDTCQGDSGGPLMMPEFMNRKFPFFLIGIVSYGIGCARPGVPDVYTSVQYFVDWIEQQVADTP